MDVYCIRSDSPKARRFSYDGLNSSSTDALTASPPKFQLKRNGHCMASLDIVMFLNGIKLYDKEWRLTNLFFRFLFIAYNYFHLLKNIYVFEFNAENMRKFIYISVHLTAIISHHYFLHQSKAIRKLFKSVISLIQKKQQSDIRWAARVALAVWFAGISWGMASGISCQLRFGTIVHNCTLY